MPLLLGKREHQPGAISWRYGDIFDRKKLQRPPLVFGHVWNETKIPMLGNDSAGCCHDANTDVLTERGWQKWPEYDGALLATMNQSTGAFELQAPLALIRKDYDGPLFYCDHKQLDFAVTPNHRMLHRSYIIPKPYTRNAGHYGPWQFSTASDLPPRIIVPGTTTGVIGVGLKHIQLGPRVWLGDEFIALVALLLSDGFVGGTEKTWNRVSFCCFDPKDRDRVATLAHRLWIKEAPERPGVWRFHDIHLADWMRANGYIGNTYRSPFKRVPDIIKCCSQEQIEIFLNFYGDQSLDNGVRTFSTTSKRMADDLQELLLRVGKRSSIRSRPPREGRITGRYPEFTVREYKRGHAGLGKNNDLVQEHYRGEVFCATVPNSTLVTRRNGKVLVSGNCVFATMAHLVQTMQRGLGNKESYFSDDSVLSDYSQVTGYIPGNPATDKGTYMRDGASFWRQNGILDGHGVRHKIEAYVDVRINDPDELFQACFDFGGVALGLRLPQNAIWQFEHQRPWTMPIDKKIAGGHAVALVGRNRRGEGVIATWNGITAASRDFMREFTDECVAFISLEYLDSRGINPRGYDRAALEQRLAAL